MPVLANLSSTFSFTESKAHVCCYQWVAGQVPACKHKFKTEIAQTHKKVDASGLWAEVAVNNQT